MNGQKSDIISRRNIIRNYYEPNMNKGLPDHKVLGWESKEAQYLRFETLVSNVDLENKSILDVGCGLGNMLEYLMEKGIKVDYTGVDILESMINQAKTKNLPGEFVCVDIFDDDSFRKRRFDVVFTSGIFNLNLSNNMKFLESSLECFIKLTRGYVVFNLLHKKSPAKEELYFYYDPDEVKILVRNRFPFVGHISVFEGYLNNDFTVILKM